MEQQEGEPMILMSMSLISNVARVTFPIMTYKSINKMASSHPKKVQRVSQNQRKSKKDYNRDTKKHKETPIWIGQLSTRVLKWMVCKAISWNRTKEMMKMTKKTVSILQTKKNLYPIVLR